MGYCEKTPKKHKLTKEGKIAVACVWRKNMYRKTSKENVKQKNGIYIQVKIH